MTEAQARRMVEKFRLEGEANPAAAREAVLMLAEEAGIYGGTKEEMNHRGTETQRKE